MTYHSRSLEGFMDIKHGYRVTHVDEFTIAEDGKIGTIKQSFTDRKQIKSVDPFKAYPASCVAQMAGVTPVAADEVSRKYGVGNMNIMVNNAGDFTQVKGVEFTKTASKVTITAAPSSDGEIKIFKNAPDGELLATVKVTKASEMTAFAADVKGAEGKADLFFVFDLAKDSQIKDWVFA